MKLVIVESPTKAKTISKFLGKGYKVTSSFGHVRDLPKSKLGIDVDHNFEPQYVVPTKAKKHVKELKELASKADEIILATDEDREGEAIAWHLISAADLSKKPMSRIVFHEITKSAIENAIEHPRELNIDLVDAQQARRVLDRLVGYKLSPLLWKKIARGLSAGRVQSVAVRLIVEREREIEAFKPQEYWTIDALLKKEIEDSPFDSQLHKIDGKKLDKFAIGDEKAAQEIVDNLKDAAYVVEKITKRETKKRAPAPFRTSTLQQEASSKLGFSPKQTMMLAQKLYEKGYITYMRTDSLNLSAQAVAVARDYIEASFGKNYLPEKAVFYKTKSKGAQEAHEAIRPTNPGVQASELKGIDDKQKRLYTLIWQRTLASQMKPAIMDATSVDIQAKNYTFRTTGSVVKFDGFLKVYPAKTKETYLPVLAEGDDLKLDQLKPVQHFTEPPARYSEATLVKALEEKGIGRPSTYAPTISTIQTRNYVVKNDDKRLEPTEMGKVVNDVLVEHFQDIVDYDFTAELEEKLDDIAEGKKEWQEVIGAFYSPFIANVEEKEKTLSKKEITEEKTDEVCDKCGSPMVIKMGRFGKFMACSNYPECKNTKPLPGEEKEEEEVSDEVCDKCGSPMVVKHGRYGKFLGCSNYPDCKNIKSLAASTGVKCPKCGKGEIVEKRSKRGKIFYACDQYPDCDFALWNKPTGEKCPDCGSLLVEAGKKHVKCSDKECGYKVAVETDEKEKE